VGDAVKQVLNGALAMRPGAFDVTRQLVKDFQCWFAQGL
jgi:hypothetical protein